MSDDRGRDTSEKRDGASARSCGESDKNNSSRNTSSRQSNPMRFFETGRVTPKPNRLDKAWGEVEIVCRPMQARATGRTPTPDEMKAAASKIKEILAQHFPEGPRGAARAQRRFVRWPDGEWSGQTPGTARWAAACRDVARLECDPAKPNYLAELSPVDGVDFTKISRGLDLRARAMTYAKANIWSSLAWRTTPDGGLRGRPVARLQPDRGENSDRDGTNECSYVAVRNTEAILPPSARCMKARPSSNTGRWESPTKHPVRLGCGARNDTRTVTPKEEGAMAVTDDV
jgi:hypothetical protein